MRASSTISAIEHDATFGQSMRSIRPTSDAHQVDGERRHQEADRRADAGAGRHDDVGDAELLAQARGMDRARAAEGDQRDSGQVLAVLDRVHARGIAAMFSSTTSLMPRRRIRRRAAASVRAGSSTARCDRSRGRSVIAPPAKYAGIDAAEHEVGIGDGRLGAAAAVAGRAGLRAGAAADRRCIWPHAVVDRAMEPPPAPISIISMTGMQIGRPLPFWKRARAPPRRSRTCGRRAPFSIRQIFAVVPPMSKESTWSSPDCCAEPRRRHGAAPPGRIRPGGSGRPWRPAPRRCRRPTASCTAAPGTPDFAQPRFEASRDSAPSAAAHRRSRRRWRCARTRGSPAHRRRQRDRERPGSAARTISRRSGVHARGSRQACMKPIAMASTPCARQRCALAARRRRRRAAFSTSPMRIEPLAALPGAARRGTSGARARRNRSYRS